MQKASVKDDLVTPKTWKQLLWLRQSNFWISSAQGKMNSLVGMKTWTLVPPRNGRKIIRSKWVFKVKRRADGSIIKMKAFLVAMGFSQVKGLNFSEVFAPTLCLETILMLLSLMGSKGWKGCQIDFKTDFLNGHLEKPVYMFKTPGFEDTAHPEWVCKVSWAIYGLKKSHRQWNIELCLALISLGLSQSLYNPSLFFRLNNGHLVGALTAHVNNLAVVGTSSFVAKFVKDIPASSCSVADHQTSLPLRHSTIGSLALSYGFPNAVSPTSPLPSTNCLSSCKTLLLLIGKRQSGFSPISSPPAPSS